MPGALSTLKVLDFSTLLPGPYATMMLADMGAEVLRVESPRRVDLVRVLPPMIGKVSAAHAYLNRGKKSLALDLKKEGAVEVVRRLVKQYDIVIEQFRPGVMDKLGVGYEVLKAINPALVYCSITGYGQTGPYRDRAGHDINYLALSGVASYSRRDGERPVPLGIQVADIAGGSHHAVMAILAAVIHRSHTGKGQFIDISMTDAAFSLNAMSGAGYLSGGVHPEPESDMLNGGGFYDYYETADGRYFSIGGLEPQFMRGLCSALGRPDLAAQGMSQKREDRQAFKVYLAEQIKTKNFDDWVNIFAELDVCAEPVLTLAEATEHKQLIDRNMVVEVPFQAEGVKLSQPGFPVKFSETACQADFAGVAVGADTDEVLSGLGFAEDEMQLMKQNRVFG
ncbi:MAG: carnitine dehydratase [Proteobacteria bacterium]|nr:MAG: carnitine dehydratase [Pseudomonadota bacterium]